MKKKKENKFNIEKKTKKYDKSQIFVKVVAGFLTVLMLFLTGGTLIYAIIG